jgi:two-component system chemotaxis sensor kinase CheA
MINMNMQAKTDFLQKLTATFLVEANEHVQVLGAGLLALEKAAGREEQLSLVETVFREAHCLKGAARAINAGEIERLCQKLEGVSAEIKSGKSELTSAAIAGMHRMITSVSKLVEAQQAGPPQTPGGTPQTTTEPAAYKPPAINRGEGGDTVRIATHKLDDIFVQVEELLGVKLAQAERASELKSLAGMVAERDRLWNETMPLVRSLRQQVEARDAALTDRPAGYGEPLELSSRLLEFLEQDRDNAANIGDHVARLTRVMAHDRRRFDIMTERLLNDVKQALMLPFETILAGFPKMVHDVASDVGKEIIFNMRGADVEIDKRILEKIKNPLLHLVRNSIDHGIEAPATRARSGKAPSGRVTLAITQAEGKVEIAVSDDGVGVNPSAVREAAVEAGMLTAGEATALDDQDVLQLVFRSGVTTRQHVTAISGRGLGMAIVEENVAKLGGTVSLESTPGAGTTVRIWLPLTLATLRGTLVQAANREFVIPTVNVTRVVRFTRASIRRVENRDSICLNGTTMALVSLADVLGLVADQASGGRSAMVTALVLACGNSSIVFVVDQLMGEQEVLAKPLGRLLPRVRHVTGATVVGGGRVVPILSVPDLLQGAAACAQTSGLEPGMEVAAVKVRRLLVVDDSITARTLLQNILESSGYSVKTAADGAAAFATLQHEPFDLVVSDVEMPRMNGFELVKRMRAEARLANLPVVLVTGLEARNDRERGIDAGANAYIVKSGFDQSNLLEVIGKLI